MRNGGQLLVESLSALGRISKAAPTPDVMAEARTLLPAARRALIRAHQERHYPGRVSGTTLRNPDLVTLAQSYGCHAERVERTADFPAAFARALASETGAVLDLNISPEAPTPRQTLSQMRAAALVVKENA